METKTSSELNDDITRNKNLKTNHLPPEHLTNNEYNNDERVSPLPPVNRLCEDELSLIFSNLCITTRDLLNLRTVSKNWRDAATTILLRRDACYVTVGKGSVVARQDNRDRKKCDFCNSIFCQHEVKKAARNELSKLTDLICNSQKFPSSNLHLWSCWNTVLNFVEFPDLVLFFKLHGAKFKTLVPHGSVSREYFQDIFSINEFKLECLDLTSAMLRFSDKNDGSNNNVGSASTSKSKVLPFKTIILGSGYIGNPENGRDVVHFLLSVPSKLNCISMVQPSSELAHVLKEGKGSLVKSFNYNFQILRYNFDFTTCVSLTTNFAGINPKLSKLTLHLNIADNTYYVVTLTSINAIIESSKDTLQNLEIIATITSCSEDKLKIPPLKNLKCITLNNTFSHFPMVEDEIEIGYENKSIFVLQGHIQEENYFPNLNQVILKNQDLSIKKFHQMCFIKPGSNRIQILPKVEMLHLQNSTLPSKIPDAKLISSAVFPNVRILKSTWDSGCAGADKLYSSFWLLCPLVEFIEIYNLPIEIDKDTKRINTIMDAFFTGFCPTLCRKLQTMELPEHMHSLEIYNFLRINPSVCDLRYLKELKLKFRFAESCMYFPSDVTVRYAFSQMPNTKFYTCLVTDSTDYRIRTTPEDFPSWLSFYLNFAHSVKDAAFKTGPGYKTIKPSILQSDIMINCLQVTPPLLQTNTPSFSQALSLIFSHSCVSTSDLLNFRLVSQVWCDIATNILLDTGTCYVSLELQPQLPNKFTDYFVCKSGDKNTKLEILTELMSNSLRFPSCNFHIDATDSWDPVYIAYTDLSRFFELHGNKIKTLCPIGKMNAQNLKTTLLYFVPNLQCLDLSNTKLNHVYTEYSTEFLRQNFKDRILKILPLKSVILSFNFGYHVEAYSEVLHELLSFPSNLSSMQNVNLSTLPYILKEEKGHLIKDLEYIMPHDYSETDFSLLKQFSTLNPKLSKLFLNVNHSKLYSEILPSINVILKSSQDTLQELEIAVYPLEYSNIKIKIPPMKNLKSLTWNAHLYFTRTTSKMDDLMEERGGTIFSVEDRLCGEKYFPNLVKVVLRKEMPTIAQTYVLIRFLQFKSDDENETCLTCLPTVQKLELHGSYIGWQNLHFTKHISKVFPNVRLLKIAWDRAYNVLRSLWDMCLLVEFMEIYDVFVSDENDDYATDRRDMYFTGFSFEMCRKLRTADEIPQHMDKLETWDFLRHCPSICDLRYLKEFKLTFLKDSLTQFASRVTGQFAFAQMPYTKFVISYDPKHFFDATKQGDEAHEKTCFSSIIPYAQVVREERIKYKLKYFSSMV